MGRFLRSTWWWFFVCAIQLGFISSLPEPFMYTPLLVATALARLRRETAGELVAWLVGFGILLELLSLSTTAFDPIVYAGGALVAYLGTRFLFSDQSLFRLLSNATLTWLTICLLTLALLWIQQLIGTDISFFKEILSSHASGLVLLWGSLLIYHGMVTLKKTRL